MATVGAMGFFVVLFWCAAVARGVLRHHSRFGVFNSRLGADKFPFGRLRELVGKGLICLVVFGAETALMENNRKNSRVHGNNREFRPRRNGRWRNLQWRRFSLPAADRLVACQPTGVQPFASDGVLAPTLNAPEH